MTKVLMTTAIAVASTIAISAQSKSAFDGFYVGASAGYSSLDAKEKVGIINPTTSDRGPNYRVSFSPSLKSNNFAGSVYAGYGASLGSKWHLGTEISAIYDNHNTKYKYSDNNDGSNFSDDLSRKYALALNIVPGFYLKEDILLALKTGLSLSKFSYKMSDNYQASGGDEVSYLSAKKNNMLTGFNVGARINISTTDKYSLRLDVDHTIYRNFRVTKRHAEDHEITTNIKPTVTTVMAGFSYKI